MSGVSHAITLKNPIEVRRYRKDGKELGFSVCGTPADCVRVGVRKLFKGIDLVVSGINYGENFGVNVNYSGTISAVIEARILGIKGIAVSSNPKNEKFFPKIAVFVKNFIMLLENLNFGIYTLSLNFPELFGKESIDFEFTYQGKAFFDEDFEVKRENSDVIHLSLFGEKIIDNDEAGSDYNVLKKGKVSITPVSYNLTDFSALSNLKAIFAKNRIRLDA